MHASKISCVGRRLSAMRGLRRRHLARGLVKLAQSKLSLGSLASRFRLLRVKDERLSVGMHVLPPVAVSLEHTAGTEKGTCLSTQADP